jgi:hypothetical protein
MGPGGTEPRRAAMLSSLGEVFTRPLRTLSAVGMLALVVASIVFTIGCGQAANASLTVSTRVEGGPTRESSSGISPAGRITIESPIGHVVARLRTDRHNPARISLKPGRYLLTCVISSVYTDGHPFVRKRSVVLKGGDHRLVTFTAYIF